MPTATKWTYSALPEQGREDRIDLELLRFDAQNPRLASGSERAEKPSQGEILHRLWTEMAVDEVAISIAANGYYPEERLIVIPNHDRRDPGSFIVLEGNRRLAAVQLLVDPKLRAAMRATDLPATDPKIIGSLKTLPVTIYRDRKSLWSYLGFRHINGTKPWDAFSKAQYVADVYENYGISLREIADRIGDRHSTVTRLYRGLKILQQAEDQASFDVEDRVRNRFYFSHLYTAADQPDYQRFLGITSEGSLKANPVPRSRLRELGELAVWLYGRKSTNTPPVVQTQFPDLNNLRGVIGNRAGLSALRSGLPLATALEISIGDDRRFREALTRAAEEMRRAKGTVTTGYKGESDLLETIDDIHVLAESIRQEMQGMHRGPKGRRTK
jgi:hypothetical protein